MRTNEQIELIQLIIENLQDYSVLAKAQQKLKDKLKVNDLECDLNDLVKTIKEMVNKL